MKNGLPAVDAYVEKSAEFAKPILKRIRQAFHKGCPDVEETMKWGVPHFEYKGVLGSMAAFKQHVGFGFWKQSLMNDPCKLFSPEGNSAMGGTRINSLSELPSEAELIRYVKQAVKLNEDGVKVARAKKAKKPLPMPDDLAAALNKNAKAKATFEAFSPSHKREYIEWIIEAKREATREKRLATAIEWMAEGKPHNWKYMKK